MDVLVIVWRSAHLTLAVVGLFLLFWDLRQRRREKLDGRFYWQSMALLLFSIAYGSALNIWDDVRPDVIRLSLTSVALIYLIVAVILAARDRRPPDEEDL